MDALHQHKRDTKRPFCKLCNLAFQSEKAFLQHRRGIHTHVCGRCNSRHDTPRALEDHQKSKGHYYSCATCKRHFNSPQALEDHRSTLHSFLCSNLDCNSCFDTFKALQEHQRSKGHSYCKSCNKFFRNSTALDAHRISLHTFPCPKCNRCFNHQDTLQNHQKSKKHCFCVLCNTFFGSNLALEDHLKSPPHVSQFSCCDCDRDFVDEGALMQHLADKYHPHEAKKYAGFRCAPCNRAFNTQQSLEQHKESVKHNPISNIKCIASMACTKRFSCPSAQLHHLESGACVSGMTKKKLDATIVSQDTEDIISFSALQAESLGVEAAIARLGIADSSTTDETDTNSGAEGAVIFTPTSSIFGEGSDFFASSPGQLTPTSSVGFDSIPRKIHCPVCPPNSRRSFRTISALQDHVASPIHNKKIFHCPVSLAESLRGVDGSVMMKQFSTLSGLAQHLESGACEGGIAMLKKAVDYIQEEMGALGFVGVSLLK